jgi:hypothetical protein
VNEASVYFMVTFVKSWISFEKSVLQDELWDFKMDHVVLERKMVRLETFLITKCSNCYDIENREIMVWTRGINLTAALRYDLGTLSL